MAKQNIRESGPESRVENPLVAQIMAEKEDWYRSGAESAREFLRRLETLPEEEAVVESKRKAGARAKLYEDLAPVAAESWRKVTEVALENGIPLPLSSAEKVRLFELYDARRRERSGFGGDKMSREERDEGKVLSRRSRFYHFLEEGAHSIALLQLYSETYPEDDTKVQTFGKRVNRWLEDARFFFLNTSEQELKGVGEMLSSLADLKYQELRGRRNLREQDPLADDLKS